MIFKPQPDDEVPDLVGDEEEPADAVTEEKQAEDGKRESDSETRNRSKSPARKQRAAAKTKVDLEKVSVLFFEDVTVWLDVASFLHPIPFHLGVLCFCCCCLSKCGYTRFGVGRGREFIVRGHVC